MSAVRPPLETVRAWVEGTLSPRERDAFGAAMAADRGLADLVASYADVHAATVDPAPPCPVTADALRLDAPPVRTPVLTLLRRAAPIAAALLVVAGAAFALSRMAPSEPSLGPVEGGTLSLRAIRAAAHEPPPAPPAIAALYTPATDGRLAFLEDYDEARAVARASSRPLLVFLSMEGCPICNGMRAQAFRDEDVVRAADGFVLVAVTPGSIAEDDPAVRGIDFRKGWPWFVALDTSGARRREHAFPLTGTPPNASEVADELKAAYGALPPSDRTRPPPWDDVHAAARALRRADDDADPAARRAAWTSASRVPGPLGERARSLLAEDAKGARDALEAARETAAKEGAPAAVRRLDADLRRFAGTPYADDLRRVRDRLARDGAFPPVVLAR